jgi:hypothetical protein
MQYRKGWSGGLISLLFQQLTIVPVCGETSYPSSGQRGLWLLTHPISRKVEMSSNVALLDQNPGSASE